MFLLKTPPPPSPPHHHHHYHHYYTHHCSNYCNSIITQKANVTAEIAFDKHLNI